MQGQNGTCQARIAQGSHQAGSIAAAGFNPAANNHGGRHFGQAGHDAGIANAARADFPFHGIQNGQQARIVLGPSIGNHGAGHEFAQSVHAAQIKLHATVEQNCARGGVGTRACADTADGLSQWSGLKAVYVLNRDFFFGQDLMAFTLR